jgi:hypothetical protein
MWIVIGIEESSYGAGNRGSSDSDGRHSDSHSSGGDVQIGISIASPSWGIYIFLHCST